MVLFKAEALVMTGKPGAAKELNRLTKRAGLGDLYTEGQVKMEDVMHERRCELAFEFTDRFMDLKRWSRLTNIADEYTTAAILGKRTRGHVPADASDPDTQCTVREIWPVGDGAPAPGRRAASSSPILRRRSSRPAVCGSSPTDESPICFRRTDARKGVRLRENNLSPDGVRRSVSNDSVLSPHPGRRSARGPSSATDPLRGADRW